jgi:predicted nucleic acid-binding protein
VIFVDSNIPMYLIGADHPLKPQARRAVEDALAADEVLCTDAEVFQEILHRYRAVGRREDMDAAFAALHGIIDVAYPIELADVERARRLLSTTTELSARDALHIAVMQAHDVGRIMSFDRGFDGIPGLERIA